MDWTKKEFNESISRYISSRIGVSPVIAELLTNRGIDSPEKAFYFLYGELGNTHSPFLFSQMEKTVEYLKNVIRNKKSIYILGDKDVDGITGTAILYSFFQKAGMDHIYYDLPTDKETYGFSNRMYKGILEKENLETVITVDCGIKENDFIANLNEKGINTIVTDHHTPPETLPDAYSIVNPHLEPGYKIQYLSGAAVAFKVVQGLYFSYHSFYNKPIFFISGNRQEKFKGILTLNFVPEKKEISFENRQEMAEWLKNYPEMILVGEKNTLQDLKEILIKPGIQSAEILSLVSENLKIPYSKLDLNRAADILKIFYDPQKPHRTVFSLFKKIFFTFYLKIEEKLENILKYAALGTVCDYMPLNHVENHILVRQGLELLNKATPYYIQLITSEKEKVDMQDIGFAIGPLLNSGGRLGESQISFEFIIRQDKEEVDTMYQRLKKLNEKRKKIGTDAYKEAIHQIELFQKEEEVLIYSSSNMIQGVTGIIATRISRNYHKPSFAFFLDEEKNEVVGSGRSFQNIDILNILSDFEELFSRFGGHKQACGMSFSLNRLEEITGLIREKSRECLQQQDHADIFYYDMELAPEKISFSLLHELKKLYPFGPHNEEPVFFSKNLTPVQFRKIGKKQNHVKFKVMENPAVDFIGWNMADQEDLLVNSRLDILYQIQENFFRNQFYLQGNILAVRETVC